MAAQLCGPHSLSSLQLPQAASLYRACWGAPTGVCSISGLCLTLQTHRLELDTSRRGITKALRCLVLVADHELSPIRGSGHPLEPSASCTQGTGAMGRSTGYEMVLQAAPPPPALDSPAQPTPVDTGMVSLKPSPCRVDCPWLDPYSTRVLSIAGCDVPRGGDCVRWGAAGMCHRIALCCTSRGGERALRAPAACARLCKSARVCWGCWGGSVQPSLWPRGYIAGCTGL